MPGISANGFQNWYCVRNSRYKFKNQENATSNIQEMSKMSFINSKMSFINSKMSLQNFREVKQHQLD